MAFGNALGNSIVGAIRTASANAKARQAEIAERERYQKWKAYQATASGSAGDGGFGAATAASVNSTGNQDAVSDAAAQKKAVTVSSGAQAVAAESQRKEGAEHQGRSSAVVKPSIVVDQGAPVQQPPSVATNRDAEQLLDLLGRQDTPEEKTIIAMLWSLENTTNPAEDKSARFDILKVYESQFDKPLERELGYFDGKYYSISDVDGDIALWHNLNGYGWATKAELKTTPLDTVLLTAEVMSYVFAPEEMVAERVVAHLGKWAVNTKAASWVANKFSDLGSSIKRRWSNGVQSSKVSSSADNLSDFLQLQKGGVDEFNSIGRLQRNGERLLLNQGRAPTCGPNSTCMALHTMGQRVDISDLISQLNIDPRMGVSMADLVPLFKKNDINATFNKNLSISQLQDSVANGNPAVVRVMQDVYGGKPEGHAIVVDGFTERLGKPVVAIRDPHGNQYFELLESFKSRYLKRGGLGTTGFGITLN